MTHETEQEQDPGSALPSSAFARTLDHLASTDDPIERRRLARMLGGQISRLVGQTADNAQVAVWSTEEWVRQRVGETNTMIADLATMMRQVAEGISRLETDLRAQGDTQGLMAGHLSALTERIDRRFEDHETRIARLERAVFREVAARDGIA